MAGFVKEKLRVLEISARFEDKVVTSKEEQNLVVQKLLGSEPSFRQLAILDAEGKTLAYASRTSSFASDQLTIRAAQDVFPSVLNGQNYISSVYIDESTSEPKVTLAVPTKNLLGDFKGVLMAEVNLKFMWDLVSNIKVGTNGLAYVVNKQGDLLAFNDTSRILKGENVAQLTEVAKFIKNSASHTDGSTSISQGIQNTRVVSTHIPLQSPNWAVVVELPLLEAYDPIVQMLIRSVLIICFGLVLTIIASVYLSNNITRPIRDLSDAASQISKGALGTKIETTAQDEIGQLAAAFNGMTSQLQQSYQSLEQKVKERTEELDKKISQMEQMNKLMIGREIKMTELKRRIVELEGQNKPNA